MSNSQPMIEVELPEGFTGQILAPNPESWPTAKQMSQWFKKTKEIEDSEEYWLYKEAYTRCHFLQFNVSGEDGKRISLTEKAFKEMEYPHVFAMLIIQATEPILTKSRDKKKSPGELPTT